MTEPLLIQRQRTLLHGLTRLADERARAEQDLTAAFRSRKEAAEKQVQEDLQSLASRFEAERAATEQEFSQVRETIAAHFEAESKAAKIELADTRLRITEAYDADKAAADERHQEAVWTIATVFEADKSKADHEFQTSQRKLAGHLGRIADLRREADRLFAGWVLPEPDAPAAEARPSEPAEDSLPRVRERVSAAEAHLLRSKKLWVLKLARGKRVLALMVLLDLLAAAPAVWSPVWYSWVAAGVLLAVVGGVAAHLSFKAIARAQVRRVYRPLCQALAEAEAWCCFCQGQAAAGHQRQLADSQRTHDTASREADTRYRHSLAALRDRRDAELRQAEERYRRRMILTTRQRDTDSQNAEEKYPRTLAELRRRFEADSDEARQRCRRELDDNRAAYTAAWQALTERWRRGLEDAGAEATATDRESRQLFPTWDNPSWQAWQPPANFPPVLQFGECTIDLADIPHGIPHDERLQGLGPERFTLPALLAFPDGCSLLIQVEEGGRSRAEEFLQVMLFRLLAAIPPAKARFTIIDPVGLGQSFAAFMHLADHDEALVASRIWTEQSHIEQRLADLTAHMENVIQKYLRNQYATIEEYNAHAGEVAEPFRFLVVANFPVNFSPAAARRLVSIAASGARCGVHTLVTLDAKQPLPQGFHLEDLRRHGVLFVSRSDGFTWEDRDLGRFPLRLDPPPPAGFATPLLQVIGRRAKEASRVEVPFEFIVPPADAWWTADTRAGLDVPIGRSGATRRQHLTLGQGTAQHVLVAGKTGSGKSTLLHALITNLALRYSPEQVELYLVDFKEGVEFKDYATYELPHARVVAIESEREFGLSVLQRLEAELKERGERFRALGVQDLAGYRQADADTPLPRILLIVDEFQLFFIEDDRIAQEAALLLDRLVRQGRAFGIHILLGSQTLGGAYTLARSTLGQMAVRIALQCSEADAHLILSDDNPAARLLSRPGEAIYNDANGLVEGNDFFQVVWLPEQRREDYLRRIRALARQRQPAAARPQIVFEGKAPGDIAKNHHLNRLLNAPDWPAPARVAQAWLGEPVAIKEPTAADFRPQGGRNLLIVGQFEEAALGMLTTCLISLAAQQLPAEPPAGVQFYVLDGSPVDAEHAGYLQQVAEILPHSVRLGGGRDVLPILTELAGEVERRLQAPEGEFPARFLIIYGLQRFRDLRRAEDDFSFSRRGDGAPPNPAKLLGTVLRDGPALGVYTLVWADTLNNVNRSFDRHGLREFDLRVLFQMSTADSSTLIDSPLAGKLGLHRALLYSEDRGQMEKFRPYGLPPVSWLHWVKEQLHRRVAAPRA